MHPAPRFAVAWLSIVLTTAAAAAAPQAGHDWIIVTDPTDREITWTPTAEQVLAGREAARAAVQHAAQDSRLANRPGGRRDVARKILAQWRQYRLQACGLTDHRRRVVYLSFVTPGAYIQWKRNEMVSISDGWFYYWQAWYDPVSKRIIEWQANGRA